MLQVRFYVIFLRQILHLNSTKFHKNSFILFYLFLDLSELIESLKIPSGKVHLVGFSAGSIFAYGFISEHPEKLKSAMTIGGVTELGKMERAGHKIPPNAADAFRIFENYPSFFSPLTWLLRFVYVYVDTETFVNSAKDILSKSDSEILSRKEMIKWGQESWYETFSQGSKQAANELKIMLGANGWGISNENLKNSVKSGKVPLKLVHGLEDKNSPKEFSEFMAKELPGSELYLVPNQGHFSHLVDPTVILDWVNKNAK